MPIHILKHTIKFPPNFHSALQTSPYEARLGWAVKLDRDPFRGQQALRAAKERGPARRLYGLRADGRRIPRAGMTVTVDGEPAGTVTSGSFSPTLGIGIGMIQGLRY